MYKFLKSEILYILLTLNQGTYILYKKLVSSFKNIDAHVLRTGSHVKDCSSL